MRCAAFGRGAIAGLALSIGLAGAAAALDTGDDPPPKAAPVEDAPEVDSCFAKAAVVVYLHDMQDRILDAWKLPEDGLANHEVVLELRVDGDGTLLKYELVRTSDRRLARSVKFAVMGASPFEAVPIEAFCLVERDIRTTFGNPAGRD